MADELPPLIASLVGDASDLFTTLDEVEARLRDFANQDYTATLGINDAQVFAATAAAEANLKAFANGDYDATATVNVVPNDTGLSHLLDESGNTVTVGVGSDASDLFGILDTLQSHLDSLVNSDNIIKLGISDASVEASIAHVEAALAALNNETIRPKVDIINPVEYQLASVKADLLSVDDMVQRVRDDAIATSAALALAGGGGGGGGGGGAGLAAGAAAGIGAAGWAANALGLVHALHLFMPEILGFIAAVATSAIGMGVLAAAVAGTAAEIGQGVNAVNSAQTAIANAIPGTTQWTTGIGQLGQAWSAIPTDVQSAVASINNLKNAIANSPVGTEARSWFVGIVDQVTTMFSGIGSAFEPLILAAQRTVDTIIPIFQKAFGSQTFKSFIDTVARMVGPETLLLGQLAGAIGKVIAGFAQAIQGGEGMELLVNLFRTLADIVDSSFGQGFIQGWVDFDRLITTVAADLLHLIGFISTTFSGLQGLGAVIGFVVSAFSELYALSWVTNFLSGVFGMSGAAAGALSKLSVAFKSMLGAALGPAALLVGITGLVAEVTKLAGIADPLTTVWHAVASALGFVSTAGKSSADTISLYTNQLNGAISGTQELTAAEDLLVRSEQSIGGSLGTLANGFQAWSLTAVTATTTAAGGFGKFVQAATDSVQSLLDNLMGKNQSLAQWAADAQILIKRGMDPSAVASLAQQAPQDLASMVTATTQQLQQMNVQWQEQMLLATMSGQHGISGFITALQQGITTGTPVVKAAATALVGQLGNTLSSLTGTNVQGITAIGNALNTLPISVVEALAGKTHQLAAATTDAANKTTAATATVSQGWRATALNLGTDVALMAIGLKGTIGLVSGLVTTLFGVPAASEAATAGLVEFDTAAVATDVALGPIALVAVAVAALGVGLYELVTHFSAVSHFLNGEWGTAISAAVAVAMPLIGLPMLIMGHWRGLEEFFKSFWSDTKNWFDDGSRAIGHAAHDVAAVWDGAWKDMASVAATVSGAISTDIIKPVEDAWDSFAKWFDAYRGEIDQIMGTITDVFRVGLRVIEDVARVGWGAIEAIFRTAMTVISAVVRSTWGPVEGVIKNAVSVIGDSMHVLAAVMSGAWNIIASVIRNAWGPIAAYLKVGMDVIVGAFRVGWAAITAVVKVSWDVISGTIRVAFDVVKGIIEVGLDILTGHWSRAWHDILSTVTSVFAAISSVVTGSFNAVKSFLIGTWDAIENAAKSIFNDLLSFFESVWHSIANIFTTTATSIKNVFVDSIHWLEDAGKNIVHGLINGIESIPVIGSVAKFAGGVIHSIGSFLGIGSPSYLTYAFGQQTVQGLVNGLSDTSGQAIDAASGIASKIITAFSSIGGTGQAATAVKSLASIFTDIASVFSNIATTAKTAATVGPAFQTVLTAIQVMAPKMATLASGLSEALSAFGKVGTGKEQTSLQGISTTLGNLGKVLTSISSLFTSFGTAAKNSGFITAGALAGIENSVSILAKGLPTLSGDITLLTKHLNDLKGVSSQSLSPLKTLQGIFSALNSIFSTLGNVAKSAAPIIGGALGTVQTALGDLDKVINPLLQGIDDLVKKMGQLFGSSSDGKSSLSNLNTLLSTLGSIFKNLATDATAAGSITPASIKNIITIVQDLESAISKLPSAIGTAAPQVVTAFTNLATKISTALTALSTQMTNWNGMSLLATAIGSSSTAVQAALTTAISTAITNVGTGSIVGQLNHLGLTMSQGIAAGITSGTSGVSSAAQGVAQQAVNATTTHLRATSPSRLTLEKIGLPFSQGIAQGITAGTSSVVSAAGFLLTSLMTSVQGGLGRLKSAGATVSGALASGFGGAPSAILQSIRKIDPTDIPISLGGVDPAAQAYLAKLAQANGLVATTAQQASAAVAGLGNAQVRDQLGQLQAAYAALANTQVQLAAAMRSGNQAAITSWENQQVAAWNAAQSIGAAISAGVSAGINGESGAPVDAAQNLVNAVLSAMTGAAQVQSPSRLFANRIGTAIAQGVALGLTQGTGVVGSAAQSLIAVAMTHMQSGVAQLSGLTARGIGGLGLNAAITAPISVNPLLSPAAQQETTVLNVTSPIQINGQTLAQIVTQYQLRGARATGTPFGQYGSGQTGAATRINANAINR